MAWQFTYEGEVYNEDDLTLEQAEAIENALTLKLRETTPDTPRVSWSQIAPLRSALHARVVMSHMVADRTNVAVDVADKGLAGLKANAVIDLFVSVADDRPTEYDENGNPPEAAEPSTPT